MDALEAFARTGRLPSDVTVLHITAGGTCTSRFGGAFVLGIVPHLGLAGVFIAVSSDMRARDLVTLWRFHSGRRVAVFERQEATRRRTRGIAEEAL